MVPQQRLILNTATSSTGGLPDRRYDLYGRVRDVMLGIAMPGLVAPSRPKTRLERIIDELDALQRRTNNMAGYVFRPTKIADLSARSFIFATYAKMGADFPTPTFVLDGERGIVVKWVQNGRTVRLNCMADLSDNYIYFENGEYDVEDDVTPEILQNRLEWLTQDEREPAR